MMTASIELVLLRVGTVSTCSLWTYGHMVDASNARMCLHPSVVDSQGTFVENQVCVPVGGGGFKVEKS